MKRYIGQGMGEGTQNFQPCLLQLFTCELLCVISAETLKLVLWDFYDYFTV